MRRKTFLLVLFTATALFTIGEAKARSPFYIGDNPTLDTPQLSEADTYIDLNTKKSFRVIYDGLNDIYNREDLFPLDLYVNTRTKDTFWLLQALVVNHALLQDAAGTYRVDPNKVKREGDRYKLKVRPVVKRAEESTLDQKGKGTDLKTNVNTPQNEVKSADDQIRINKVNDEVKERAAG